MSKEKTRPRSSYHNLKSYDDELELVLELLEECRIYETEIVELFEKALVELCDLYERNFPFYFKNGANQKELNKLAISLMSGDFHTDISEVLDKIQGECRRLSTDYLTAWLLLDYELTSTATSESLKIDPSPYISLLKDDLPKVNRLIERPWCKDNLTYKDRLWRITDKMSDDLRKVIVEGIKRGWSLDRMTTIFRNITGAAEYKARRLIRTETMAVYSKVTKEIFLENGIEYVEIIGDAACGGICLDYVGGVVPLKDAELGDDLPPYHPNCACSFCAYTDFLGDSEQEE